MSLNLKQREVIKEHNYDCMFLKSFYDHFIAGPGRLSSSERIICKGENPGPSDVPVCRMKDQAESRSTTRQTGLPQM